MSKYIKRAEELRNDKNRHYNCAQVVLVPFAEELGLNENETLKISSNFGAGMKMGSVCGAITGGLMVLGLMGITDQKVIGEYYRKLKENHQDKLSCAELLAMNAKSGLGRKSHCDGMVYECVRLVEEIWKSASD